MRGQPGKSATEVPPETSMSVIKQLLLALVLLFVGLVGAAVLVPAARPFADRIGLSAPLERLGLISPVAEADAALPQGGGKAAGATAVVATEPVPEQMNDEVVSVGSARAIRSVSVSSEVTGRLRTLHIASGDFVQAGAPLAELDDEAARIALDRANVVLADAQATASRLAALKATGASAGTAVQEAELALKTAELQQRDAAFILSQFHLTAPVSGWVGIWVADPGDQVSQNTELTRIEDRSTLIVDFRVPERVVQYLKVGGQVSASPLADPTATLTGTIKALDNRVDEASRTLRVQAEIENKDDAYRPGMAFRISVAIAGESHPSVDPLAIQWGSDGPYVWLVRDGKASREAIRILQRNATSVIVDLAARPGDLVVSEGVQALRPGAAVEVSSASANTAPKS